MFGKCDNHLFNIDITYPMTPLQAFVIAISSIDGKIGCAWSVLIGLYLIIIINLICITSALTNK